MLVNTIRKASLSLLQGHISIHSIMKDLESEMVPRVCMALDNLIVSPSEAVIPAVQARLHHLLSYDKCVMIGIPSTFHLPKGTFLISHM